MHVKEFVLVHKILLDFHREAWYYQIYQTSGCGIYRVLVCFVRGASTLFFVQVCPHQLDPFDDNLCPCRV